MPITHAGSSPVAGTTISNEIALKTRTSAPTASESSRGHHELYMPKFKLVSKFQPTGDQPQAIKQLTDGVLAGEKEQTLLGVTGSGKNLYDGKHYSKCTEADANSRTQQNPCSAAVF